MKVIRVSFEFDPVGDKDSYPEYWNKATPIEEYLKFAKGFFEAGDWMLDELYVDPKNLVWEVIEK